MEENKGCGLKLPTGPNCSISGISQRKKRRTTPLLIKKERHSMIEQQKRERRKIKTREKKRQTQRVEEMDRKDTQGCNGADHEMIALSLYVLVCKLAVRVSSERECSC